jgi:hypothetical protein
MLTFATILASVNVKLSDVRLLRHQDTRYPGYPTPYVMWRDDRERFEAYQQTQSFKTAPVLGHCYWASFVGLPSKEALFVGLYKILGVAPLPTDRPHPVDGSIETAGSCNFYFLEKMDDLASFEGRLLIDWGPGTRSWVQRADSKPKQVIELRREFQEPEFPGYSGFRCNLSEFDKLPRGWMNALAAVRGIYLLTCPKTKEQYVGSASGDTGFIGRWRDYAATGHGGNIGLKSRDPSDYQVSVLETVGNAATERDILSLEALWKAKLQSREMGLNRN